MIPVIQMMNAANKLSIFFKKASHSFKYAAAAILLSAAALTLLRFPSESAKGVSDGIELCFTSVIPSLFPFLVLSPFFTEYGLSDKIGSVFRKPVRFIFRQSPNAASVILFSNIGGFPVGARMIKQLFESGKISRGQGQRLMLFCINPGPAFVISCVGHGMLGSAKAGTLIFASLVASALLLGFFTRFAAEEPENKFDAVFPSDGKSASAALVAAAGQSTSGIIGVCGWVIIFSAAARLLEIFELSDGIQLLLRCTLEITNGCKSAAGRLPIPVIAGIIGWSGLCVHCQVMPTVLTVGLPVKVFLTGRIVNGALAAVICQGLLKIFPVNTAALSFNADSVVPALPASPPAALGLLIMCALLLLGENFTAVKKRRI